MNFKIWLITFRCCHLAPNVRRPLLSRVMLTPLSQDRCWPLKDVDSCQWYLDEKTFWHCSTHYVLDNDYTIYPMAFAVRYGVGKISKIHDVENTDVIVELL